MQLAFEENEHGYEQRTRGKRGELTYAHRFCKRLLRRPCTGWRQRVLRAGCGGQVDWRNQLWLWVSASKRRADEGGVLQLVVQARRTVRQRRRLRRLLSLRCWRALRLRAEGLSGATVLHGVAGLGANSVIHTPSLIELSADLPVVIEVVDDQEHVDRLIPILDQMITGGALVEGRARGAPPSVSEMNA